MSEGKVGVDGYRAGGGAHGLAASILVGQRHCQQGVGSKPIRERFQDRAEDGLAGFGLLRASRSAPCSSRASSTSERFLPAATPNLDPVTAPSCSLDYRVNWFVCCAAAAESVAACASDEMRPSYALRPTVRVRPFELHSASFRCRQNPRPSVTPAFGATGRIRRVPTAHVRCTERAAAQTLGALTGHGRVSAADVDAAMREVRLALLEADVNFKVVKDFVRASANGLPARISWRA